MKSVNLLKKRMTLEWRSDWEKTLSLAMSRRFSLFRRFSDALQCSARIFAKPGRKM